MSDGDVTLTVTVNARTAAYLRALTRSSSVPNGTLEDVVSYLVHSAADGMRRPGSWERGWLTQAFGDFPNGPHTEGVPYSHLEPWQPGRIDAVEVFVDDGGGPCAECGCPLADVHVTAPHDDECGWQCLGCLTASEELIAEPADIAVASLISFVMRCFEKAAQP